MDTTKVKQDIVEIGRRMYNRQFVASNDGNLSVRISENEIIITPTGVSKGFMELEDLVTINFDGEVIDGTTKPSSEYKMHLTVYQNRPDVFAVCHAHPQIATAFAVARKVWDQVTLPEVVFSIGTIKLADYATPSTQQVPESISEIIKTVDTVLLSNHGALTIGSDIYDAYYKMETLEHFAGISLYARLLGGEVALEPEQIKQLHQIKKEKFTKSDQK